MQLESQQFYVYGAGIYGKALVDTLLEQGRVPKAILDRSPKAGSYKDVPIIQFTSLMSADERPVLLTVLGYSSVEADVKAAGYTTVIDALTVMALVPDSVAALNQCGFLWMQSPAALQYDVDACPAFYRLLADERSRQTFVQLCNFRQFPSANFYPEPETYEMYFPQDIAGLYDYPEIRLLDVGAFDGDTLAGFYRRWPQRMASYTGLEISSANISALWQRVQRMGLEPERVNVIKGAVGVQTGVQLAIEENKSATRIRIVADGESVDPTELVSCMDLGEIAAQQQCNVLKMDIEGADYMALKQAIPYIKAQCPTLALSVYHRPQDLWQMPLLVESACPGRYRWFIRQEGHWGLETICYGVPA